MAVQKKEDGAFRKLKEDLAQENPARFYVFYGEEDYLRQFYLKELRRICGGPFDAFDTIVLDAEQVNADTLTDAIDSFPMGSERKLVILRDYKIWQPTGDLKDLLPEILANLPEHICLVVDCDRAGRIFGCKVSGAISQQEARAIARRVVGDGSIRRTLLQGENAVKSILYAVNSEAGGFDYANMQISLETEGVSYVIYEENTVMRIEKEHLLKLLEGAEITVKVALSDGNYTATAFGCLELKEISM